MGSAYRDHDDTKRYPSLEHQHELDRNARDYETKRAEAVRRSEVLRAALNKGIRRGDPADQLLLMAVECIGLMSGDTVFIAQNQELLRKRGIQKAI